MTKLYIASDHAAFEEKEILKKHLSTKDSNYEVIDLGPNSSDRCNYPDFAIELSKKCVRDECLGILLCGSGVGMTIVANRYRGIRAALCRSSEDAILSKEHNDSNVLCLGARVTSGPDLKNIADAWLSADFQEGRHAERLKVFEQLGENI